MFSFIRWCGEHICYDYAIESYRIVTIYLLFAHLRICASPVPFENRLFTVNTFPTWTVAQYTGILLHVKQVIVIWYCCFIGLIHSWVFNKDLQILFRIGEHNNRTASAQNGPTWNDSSFQQERKWPVHPYWKWSKECMERLRLKPKTNRWMLWTVRKIWNMINSHTIGDFMIFINSATLKS